MSNVYERIENHLAAADLLDGYFVQYRRWNDANKAATLLIRKMQSGASDHLVQRVGIKLVLMTEPRQNIEQAEERLQLILRYIRANYKAPGLLFIQPISEVKGPFALSDDRAAFELDLRCLTDDQ